VLDFTSRFECYIVSHFLLEFRLEEWDIHIFKGLGVRVRVGEPAVDPNLCLQAGVVIAKPPGYLLEGNAQISAFRYNYLFKVGNVMVE